MRPPPTCLSGRNDHSAARLRKALLVRLIRHVGDYRLDDLTDDRLIQSEPAGEPIEAAHHVRDRHPCIGLVSHVPGFLRRRYQRQFLEHSRCERHDARLQARALIC